jgi:hypothetical protein
LITGLARNYTTEDDFGKDIIRQEYTIGESLWFQLLLTLFYNLLAWYAGQVFAADEGSHQRAWFCLLRS